MATAAYSLCALTSCLCAVLLIRAQRRSPMPLLFWSAVCFVLLAVNNVVLVIDLSIVPDTDLSALRKGSGLVGLLALLYGLITTETEGGRA